MNEYNPIISMKKKDIPKRGKPLEEEDITYELVYDCYVFTAKLVKERGKKFLPLFERMQKELKKYEQEEELINQALRVADTP